MEIFEQKREKRWNETQGFAVVKLGYNSIAFEAGLSWPSLACAWPQCNSLKSTKFSPKNE